MLRVGAGIHQRRRDCLQGLQPSELCEGNSSDTEDCNNTTCRKYN